MSSSTRRMLALWLASVGLCALACSSSAPVPQQQPAEPGQPDDTPATSEAEPAAAAATIKPSAETLAKAKSLGLPPVDTSGRVAGPFDGPGGTMYYLDNQKRILFFQPDQYTIYMGVLGDGGVAFKYALNLNGQYVIDASNQAKQVQAMPQEANAWPHAEAVTMILVKRLQAIKQGLVAQQKAQQDAASMQALSRASRSLHQTNMSILRNMGNDGCTKHYDGVYYLGCW